MGRSFLCVGSLASPSGKAQQLTRRTAAVEDGVWAWTHAVRCSSLLAVWSAFLCLLTCWPVTASAELETVVSQLREVTRTLDLDGVVAAVEQATVRAETGGRVAEVFFDVGDAVEAGTLLLRLVDREQKAQVAEARSGLLEAQAREQEATAEFRRVKDLLDRQLISRAAFDSAQAALRAAQARTAALRAQLKQVEEQAGYTEVRAPYNGVVEQRLVASGDVVVPGDPLFSGFSINRLRVEAHVPQRLAAAVREQREVNITLDDGRRLASGEFMLFPQAEPQSGPFQIRIDLPEGNDRLYPGTFAKVSVPVGTESSVLVPAQAIAHRGEVTGVYVQADSGTWGFRQVRLGRMVGNEVMIRAGLDGGERVALDPVAAAAVVRAQFEEIRAAGDHGGH